MSAVDPDAPQVIPVCRGLSLSNERENVCLDMLGVTPTGRLVLLACKHWRNPQARREALGQVLACAALLQRLSYGDLTARLKSSLGWAGQNPLFDHVRHVLPDLDEASFVDAVIRSLERGAFNLLIAGDGIGTDIERLADCCPEDTSHLACRIALFELQTWADPETEATLLFPRVSARTTLGGATPRVRGAHETERASRVAADVEGGANRAFWQRYIDRLVLEHPDQPPPRHGGENWVKLGFPAPARHLTAWRTDAGTIGVFFTLIGERAVSSSKALERESAALCRETGLALAFRAAEGLSPSIAARAAISGELEEQQLDWLTCATNAFVNSFRPRLAML